MRICPQCRSTYASETEFCGIDGEQLVDQETDPLIGERIDRYQFVERLGGGAMGVVYRATHTELERDFAIKVLYGEIGANKALVGRFRREARAVGKMNHPNIISVVDFGATEHGLSFLVMEYVNGRTLADAIADQVRLAPERTARIAYQIAAGLSEAHEMGFVHRDIKPANIMISGEPGREIVKILDFGIVGLTDQQGSSRLTGTGRIVGTPRYMSPEQARESGVGPPADLYSMGVILYELLSGDVPFPGDVMADVLVMHSTTPPPALTTNTGLERLCLHLLEKKPEARPARASEVCDAIENVFPDVLRLSEAPPRSESGRRPVSHPFAPVLSPSFDEDAIPTLRPQKRTDSDAPLEAPPLASETPPYPHSSPALWVDETGSGAEKLYESGPDLFSKDFERARPSSGIEPHMVVKPRTASSPFSTLGTASDAPQVRDVQRRWHIGPVTGIVALALSAASLVLAYGVHQVREREREAQSQRLVERTTLAEIRARNAESEAKKAKAEAVALRHRSATASVAAALLERQRIATQQENLLRQAVSARGLQLADVENIPTVAKRIDEWRASLRSGADSEEALGRIMNVTKRVVLTNELLEAKRDRIEAQLAMLREVDQSRSVRRLSVRLERIGRMAARKRLKAAQRLEIAKALTELSHEIETAKLRASAKVE